MLFYFSIGMKTGMKPLYMLLVMALISVARPVNAQTFLEHLQKQEPGKGTVTVSQSPAIDSLVNKHKKPVPAKTATEKKAAEERKVVLGQKTVAEKKKDEAQAQRHHEAARETQRHQAEKDSARRAEQHEREAETEEPAVDMRKKVMRRSYKVNGYRIQAFSGGNSRADKIKAQQAGERLKRAFPDQPIYVHFYSPSWKCRMGNYRSYAEAKEYLAKVRALGYKQATILRGKITVQY